MRSERISGARVRFGKEDLRIIAFAMLRISRGIGTTSIGIPSSEGWLRGRANTVTVRHFRGSSWTCGPQRLKPHEILPLSARLKSCPSRSRWSREIRFCHGGVVPFPKLLGGSGRMGLIGTTKVVPFPKLASFQPRATRRRRIPRGPRPARGGERMGLIGTTKVVPFPKLPVHNSA